MSSIAAHQAPLTVRLLTAPDPGAIAVIELRGARSWQALQAVTRRRGAHLPVEFEDRRLVLCRIVEGEETLDEAVAVTWAEGTAAEIHVHGGTRIVQRVIEQLERAGAHRDKLPQPLVAAHPLIDWVEAEVDEALMRAQTRRMTRWLLAQRRLLPGSIRAGPLHSNDPDLIRRARAAAALVRGLSVAIVGPPNAGKSTLANRLIGHERVITSDVPGTTRDWISETASIRGWQITLTDTAGIRQTGDPIEREAIRRGVGVAQRADLILVVVDACKPEPGRASEITHLLNGLPADRPRIIVLNKCDQLTSDSIPPDEAGVVRVSALTGAGRQELEAAIAMRLELDSLESDAVAPFTARQWAAIGLADADRI